MSRFNHTPSAPVSRLAFVAVLMVWGFASPAARADFVVKKTLDVPAKGVKELEIRHPLGKLTLRGWNRPRVRMMAVKRGPDEATARRLRVKGDIKHGRVLIETRVLVKGALPIGRQLLVKSQALRTQLRQLMAQPKPWSARVRADIQRLQKAWIKVYRAAYRLSAGTRVETPRAVPIQGATLELTVYIPWNTVVVATTHAGDIDAADLRGDVTLRSRQGRIYVRNVNGTLRTRSDRGRQFISRIRGPVDVNGYDGDLQMRGVRGAKVRARLARGSIVAQGIRAPRIYFTTTQGGVTLSATLDLTGRVEVRTLRGDIDVRLRAPRGFRFQARSDHGRIQLPPGARVNERRMGLRRGRVRRGASRVDLHTIHGQVRLR